MTVIYAICIVINLINITIEVNSLHYSRMAAMVSGGLVPAQERAGAAS
jgi:hypothetical protein